MYDSISNYRYFCGTSAGWTEGDWSLNRDRSPCWGVWLVGRKSSWTQVVPTCARTMQLLCTHICTSTSVCLSNRNQRMENLSEGTNGKRLQHIAAWSCSYSRMILINCIIIIIEICFIVLFRPLFHFSSVRVVQPPTLEGVREWEISTRVPQIYRIWMQEISM